MEGISRIQQQLTLDVSWTEETIDKAERLRTTMPARTLVEYAAVAVALMLVHRVVPLGTLNVIQHGHTHIYVLYVAATLVALLVWNSL